MRRILAASVLSVSLISSIIGEELDKWEIADREIIRLPPTIFSDLPRDIQRDLQVRGCFIPQMDYYDQPHNVIQGRFKNSSRIDWAVLCSVSRKSVILVYWGGTTELVEELSSWRSSDDKSWLQGTGADTVGFSRGIMAVDAKYIEDRARWYGGELPRQLDHEGIDERFDGKASTVHYWFEGKWLKLQGAD